jgi:hypothetical protein
VGHALTMAETHISSEFKEARCSRINQETSAAFLNSRTTAWQAESEGGVRGGSEPPRVLVCLGSCGY